MTFNFDNLWSFYTKACAAAGILKFLEPEKRTKLLKVYQKLCQLSFLLFVFSTVYTLSTQYTDLTVVIIASSGLVIFFAISAGPYFLLRNNDNFIEIIQWCRAIHTNDEHFHRKVQPLAEKIFDIAGRRSMKIMKIFTYLLFFDGLACTILFTITANLVPGELLLEKYHPPFPFDVPFHDDATRKSFSVNLLIQTLGILNGTLLGNAVMSIYCVIFTHFLAYLDVILGAVKNFDEMLKMKFRKEYFDGTKHGELVEILNKIQADNESKPKIVEGDFYVHIKIIVDMCSEFHQKLATFSDLSSTIFLIWEFTSLFTTFISIILLLEQQHFVLSIGVLLANFFFFIVCLVNNFILQKISEINFALYNVPWYLMKPSERRIILLAKHILDVSIGFTAGGIHDLDLERFKIVTETAISNCLVLKTLAEQ